MQTITLKTTNDDSAIVAQSMGASKRGFTETPVAIFCLDVGKAIGKHIAFEFNKKVSGTNLKPDIRIINKKTGIAVYIELDGTIHFIWCNKVSKAQGVFDHNRCANYSAGKNVYHIISTNNGPKELKRAKFYAAEVCKDNPTTTCIVVKAELNARMSINHSSVSKETIIENARLIFEAIANIIEDISGVKKINITDEYITKVLAQCALRKTSWLINAAWHYMNGDPVTVKNKGVLDLIIDYKFKNIPKKNSYLKLVASRSKRASRKLVY